MIRSTAVIIAVLFICVAAAGASTDTDAKNLLMDLNGWVETDASTSSMGSGDTRQFFATRTYRRGTASVEAALVVGITGSSIGRLPRSQVTRTTGGTSITLSTIDGFDVITSVRPERNEGVVEVLLEPYAAERDPGGKLVFRTKGMSRDEAVTFAKTFDWQAAKTVMEAVQAEIAASGEE